MILWPVTLNTILFHTEKNTEMYCTKESRKSDEVEYSHDYDAGKSVGVTYII